MSDTKISKEIRTVLREFQKGYKVRDTGKLDEFMMLFIQNDEIELIGISAFERGGGEWFEGLEKVKEIIQSDWEYWGDVVIDIPGAKITTNGDVA